MLLTTMGGARLEMSSSSVHEKDVVFNLEHGITAIRFRDDPEFSHVARSKRHAFRELTFFLLTAPVSAAVLFSWNSLNNNVFEGSERPVSCTCIISRENVANDNQLLLFTMEPNLAEFVLSMITYATTVVIYARGRCSDRWQGRILSTAILGSTMLGISLGYDLQTTILGIVTWIVVVVLILSAIAHELLSIPCRDREQYWSDLKIDEVEKSEHV